MDLLFESTLNLHLMAIVLKMVSSLSYGLLGAKLEFAVVPVSLGEVVEMTDAKIVAYQQRF